MRFNVGDKVRLKPELKKIIGSSSYRMFVDNRDIYVVLAIVYDMSGEQMLELDNDGLHYLIQGCHLVLVSDKTVGFIIED